MPFAGPKFETEITFSIENEDALVKCFRDRDKRKLLFPASMVYPFRARSYFTWKEPSSFYTFLVFKKTNWDMPRGLAFKKINSEFSGGLCSWCNSYGASDEIAMLSVAVNSTVGFSYILCNDLRCIEKIEETAALSGKSPEKWIHQLYDRIGSCFEGVSTYNIE